MPVRLPDNLAYLNEAITRLQSFDLESLGDDNPEAMAMVEAAVRRRIKGMTADEAEAALQDDLQTLTELASNPKFAQCPVHYVHGVFLGMTMWADISELLTANAA